MSVKWNDKGKKRNNVKYDNDNTPTDTRLEKKILTLIFFPILNF